MCRGESRRSCRLRRQRIARIRTLVRAAWIAVVVGAAGLTSAIFGAGAVGVLALAVGLVAYVAIMFVGGILWLGAIESRRADVVILTARAPGFRASTGRAVRRACGRQPGGTPVGLLTGRVIRKPRLVRALAIAGAGDRRHRRAPRWSVIGRCLRTRAHRRC